MLKTGPSGEQARRRAGIEPFPLGSAEPRRFLTQHRESGAAAEVSRVVGHTDTRPPRNLSRSVAA